MDTRLILRFLTNSARVKHNLEPLNTFSLEIDGELAIHLFMILITDKELLDILVLISFEMLQASLLCVRLCHKFQFLIFNFIIFHFPILLALL